MTAIAWDGKTLAADRLVSLGGVACHDRKVGMMFCEHVGGDVVYAFSGPGLHIERLIRFVEKQNLVDPRATYPDVDNNCILGLLVNKKCDVFPVYGDGTIGQMYHPDNKFIAIGSAYEFLYGALAAGVTAPTAILLAGKHRTDCGYGVDSYTIAEIEQRMR